MRSEDKGIVVFVLAILFIVLVSAIISIVPSLILAWLVLKIFPDLSLTLVQLTSIFVVISVLFRTKITISDGK